MKTLTITEAKKNLGKWLNLAGKGEDVGIVNGAMIVALRPVEVRSVPPMEIREIDADYARKEYDLTPDQWAAAEKRMEARYQREKKAGTLVKIENPTLEKLEKAVADHRRAPQTARRTPKKRAGRRIVRAA